MDSCLTQEIPVALPAWRKYSRAPEIPGYSEVTSITPNLEMFLGETIPCEGQLNSDNLFGRVHEFEGSGECIVETVSKKKKCKAYCKVTHLLDPIRTLQNFYEHPEKGVRRDTAKRMNPMNQAYIDNLANYLLGQLAERKLSPHFCLYYGGFKAIAEKYRYNITDEFGSYRKYREFWERKRNGKFTLHVERDDDTVSEMSLFRTPASSMRSSAFSYSTRGSGSTDSESESESDSDSDSGRSHITLGGDDSQINGKLVELESVHSFESGSSKCESDSDSDSDSSENMYSVFSEFKAYPVMLIFQEKMEGVLDDLLDCDPKEYLQEGTEDKSLWENHWTAWTFQIIAALCAAQGVLGFTHNDLHTNNIVWNETDESWIFYKSRDGTVWKVPTYGKIFKIIDFGRAIFRVGQTWFISDDYESGGDADGQYNFGSTQRPKKRTIYPNPSFDLCRYAVSVMDALFPEVPAEKLDSPIISQEGKWVIHETESPLWNMLWSWLQDDKGYNVLREEDGTERFPDFDLYQHITDHVKDAKPQQQLHKPIFAGYIVPGNSVGDWETIYPLYC